MRWRDWIGVGERRWRKAPDEEVQPAKTLWDWLQLLIVPAILIGITFVWSYTQTRNENKRDDRRIAADRAAAEQARQDTTLQAYLDEMSRLMLEKSLLKSKRMSPVQAVARTVTLTTLRRLDGERRGEVLRFLWEAGLIVFATVRLENADFAGANLEHAPLGASYMRRVVLRGANLKGALMQRDFLQEADLSGADLEGADLGGAYLGGANLEGANLKRAAAYRANFAGANFSGADVDGANFEFANLRGANGLDLAHFTTELPLERQRAFLDSEQAFLDSLSPGELAKFNLSPEKLASLRKAADASS